MVNFRRASTLQTKYSLQGFVISVDVLRQAQDDATKKCECLAEDKKQVTSKDKVR
jgi:hypothetical protein